MENHQIRNRAELPSRRSKKLPSKLFSDETKKSSKIAEKSLISSSSFAFSGTPTPEISDDIQETGSTENLLPGYENSPLLSASPQRSVTSDLTPSSAITTEDSELFVLDGDVVSSEASKGEAEVDMLISYLKNSTGKDPRLKKLVDALVEVMLKECCSSPDDRDWMDKLISAKKWILLSCFVMCLIATGVILLLASGIGDSTHYHPPPT